MFKLSRTAHIGIIIVLGSVLFFPFLGSVPLFDWDEINFAECAREMIVTGDYSSVQINFQAFWEKPPLFIWMQALSMKMFGVNEFAARFPNAVCGMITLVVIYLIGSKTSDKRFGMVWVLAYTGSFLPHIYFKTGIIDPWFNLFIFLGVYQAILHTNDPGGKYGLKRSALSAFFIGLATLTKGPAALLIFGLCALVFWARKKFIKVTTFKSMLLFVGIFLITAGSWFIYEILSGNFQVVKDFFIYQVRLFKTEDAGHAGFFGYHFVVLFFGCFPASVFLFHGWKKSSADTPFQKHFKSWMSNLFWVVLILFSIVETKIVHYSSLCWLPLTWLAASGVCKLMSQEIEFKKRLIFILLAVTLFFAVVFTLLSLTDQFKEKMISGGMIKDDFAAHSLQADANWAGWEWLGGIFYLTLSLFIIWKIYKNKASFVPLIFIPGMLSIFFLLIIIVPKIEKYTQAPAIEFYKSLRGKDCYLETVDFKSYAHLFYADKPAAQNTPQLLKYVNERMEADARAGREVYSFSFHACNWMRFMPIDKPAFFAVKITHVPVFEKRHPDFEKLYKKGGFVFYKRNPTPQF
jgi:hypothetical protein